MLDLCSRLAMKVTIFGEEKNDFTTQFQCVLVPHMMACYANYMKSRNHHTTMALMIINRTIFI